MDPNNTKGPVRNVDGEFIRKLELVSSKIFPLPGATFNRNNHSDPRVKVSNIPGLPMVDKITLYEHIATVRNKESDMFYVAFRQTMDCLLLEQQDVTKFPEWLMKSSNKKTELSIYVYEVKMINGQHVFPSKVACLNSHEDWLKQIESERVFDSVAKFLLNNNAITIDMFERM